MHTLTHDITKLKDKNSTGPYSRQASVIEPPIVDNQSRDNSRNTNQKKKLSVRQKTRDKIINGKLLVRGGASHSRSKSRHEITEARAALAKKK
mmetsp:Transcript_5002/g.7482  ORF Transcript_5002/g.7482 Transcript_5002/m.7482 type:complete len:93 (-) Transcript_5002:377-655(-)